MEEEIERVAMLAQEDTVKLRRMRREAREAAAVYPSLATHATWT